MLNIKININMKIGKNYGTNQKKLKFDYND